MKLYCVLGIFSALISSFSPMATWTVLLMIRHEKLNQLIEDLWVASVINFYITVNSVFSSLFFLNLSNLAYLLFGPRFDTRWWVVLILASLGWAVLVWLFMLGGAAKVSFDPFIEKEKPKLGDFEPPPIKSALTWIRLSVGLLGIGLCPFLYV